MLKRATDGRWSLLFLPLLSLITGCDINGPVAPLPEDPPPDAGNDAGPCGEDCSLIETPPCSVAVCNTGQVIGPLNTCIVVPAAQGPACDDGLFCTLGDTCDGNGACQEYPNIFVDMAQAFPFDIMTFIRNVSVDRLQYGSDVPYQSPRVEQEKLRVIGLNEEDLEKVFWRNAARIWGVDSAEARAHDVAEVATT